MKIEVLYVPGCSNYLPTLERVKEVLASEAVTDEVYVVPVSTEAEAEALLFSGSPTVRVNGKDVEAIPTTSSGLACRLYSNGKGIPPESIVRSAITEARQKE